MIDALHYDFFLRALAAGLLASVACGIVGSFVVVRRMASISGGLAHAAFGGVGLGYLLGIAPLVGAGVFAVCAALVIGWMHRRRRESADTLVSIFWSVGMALGIVLITVTPGYAPDMMSYLFGSILYVSPAHVWATLALDVLLVLTAVLLFKELRAVMFDEEFTIIAGVPSGVIFAIFMLMVALTVVILIRVVGAVLVIALVTLPAASVRPWATSLKPMMVGATAIGAFCTLVGLFGSWQLDKAMGVGIPTGPLIVLVAACIFGAAMGARVLIAKARARRSARSAKNGYCE